MHKKFIIPGDYKRKPVEPDKYVTITRNETEYLVDGKPIDAWFMLYHYSLSTDDLTYLRLGLPVRKNV